MFKGSLTRSYRRQLQGTRLAWRAKMEMSISSLVKYGECEKPKFIAITSKEVSKSWEFISKTGHFTRLQSALGLIQQLIWGYLGQKNRTPTISPGFLTPAL